MHLEAILDLPEFHLPANNTSGKPYVMYAEETLNNYINRVKSSASDFFLNCSSRILSYPEYSNEVELFGKTLIRIIRMAKTGDSEGAHVEFRALMKKARMFLTNYEGAIAFITPDDIFFRCKFDPHAGPLKTKDYFFHTPFELDYKVTGTRFTGTGVPAIYLANSLMGAYVETRAAGLNGFQGVRFRSKRLLSFLDLDYNKSSPLLKRSDPKKYELLLLIKGLIYPFLFCCYSQQNEPWAAAPHEYIIPQLLLKWVKENNKFVSGIRYPSTRIDGSNYDGTFYNLVIPPVETPDTGICPELREMFQTSNVFGYTQNQKKMQDYYAKEFSSAGVINPDIYSIDWNKRPVVYDISEIGKMEFFLKNQIVTDIDF